MPHSRRGAFTVSDRFLLNRAVRLCALAALLLLAWSANAAAQVVVFAPHPDDETLFASGIIRAAVERGEPVQVVIATNGDCKVPSQPQRRQLETMGAMRVLGLTDDDVIFLGYPDCGLWEVYNSFTSPSSRFTSSAGYSQTYGFEGLGRVDYHRYIYGVPADYNKASLLQDITNVLRNYRPQDVYVTSGYDDLNDHYTLGFAVTDAVVALARQDSTFQPTLHEAIVHEPCELTCNPSYHWPEPTFTPQMDMPEPPFLAAMTPLSWADAERVVVPGIMQSTDETVNLKHRAISQHDSQLSPWLLAFVKRDEVFWISAIWANRALFATATASSLAAGSAAASVADGSITGAPRKADGEWVSNGQLAGAWVQLNWTAAQTINRVILHDRTAANQNIQSGTLTFSDGSSLPVGALPDTGVGVTINFPQKTVSWVRFTVGSATGTSVGLAEIQVFGPPTSKLPPYVETPNSPPVITAGPFANPITVSDAGTSIFSVSASDSDNDPLVYVWSPTQGAINGSGSSVTYVPLGVLFETTVPVDLVVADGRGGRATARFEIVVTPSGQQVNIARFASAVASSQTATQLAVRAIDGVVDGYPTDAHREWATTNELAGAWIQLSWDQPQTLSRIILHDRINLNDQILSGVLRFGDGSTLPVSALPDNGAGTTMNFEVKTVPWVRLEVTNGRGTAVGLAEFEVFSPPPPGANNAPQISGGPTATPSVITDVESSTLSVSATDPDGDALGYIWQVSGGALTSFSDPTTTFIPPRVDVVTTFRVDLQITDGRGGAVNTTMNITVTPSGSPLNLAQFATVTSSSENSGRGQNAVKAIDGWVDGYPNDVTREWASVNQVAGAWIQLTWPSTQSIFRAVLHDRINTDDQVLNGVLRFSDGSTVSVGTLPNDGTGLRVNFASRGVTWVRFEVTRGRGGAIGLAEIQVFATPPAGSNPLPQITAGPTANPSSITDIETSTISVTASDPQNEPLSYSWQTTGGTLTPIATGAVMFTPPRISNPQSYRIRVEVTDDFGGSVFREIDIPVTPSGAPLNLAPYASVTASSENAGREQTASNVADGILGGYPSDPSAEWASVGQLAGAWIQMTWDAPQSIYRAVLYDRVNADDQVLAANLRFSTGTVVPVGTLPNTGGGLVVNFVPEAVTWVRLEITAARGGSVGLAEFEIYATPASGGNTPPQIVSGPIAAPATITDLQTASITVSATDEDSDPLTYSWSVGAGSLTPSGAAATFTPPRSSTTNTYRISVAVTDTVGGMAFGFVDVTVTPSGSPINHALSATITASGENAGRGQEAIKAADGFVDGYPTDPTREWSSGGQGAGAWIQMTWSSGRDLSRVVLHDRINGDDQILAATLRFSDGSTVPVGVLPNDGAGLVIDFTTRSVTSIRLEINSVRGGSTGLAEFEVY